MDSPGVLQGFFGYDWTAGVGYLHEQERRNYLFAAKSGGWAAVKRDYDIASFGDHSLPAAPARDSGFRDRGRGEKLE